MSESEYAMIRLQCKRVILVVRDRFILTAAGLYYRPQCLSLFYFHLYGHCLRCRFILIISRCSYGHLNLVGALLCSPFHHYVAGYGTDRQLIGRTGLLSECDGSLGIPDDKGL